MKIIINLINLALKGINFSYPGSNNYVLNDLSIHIKRNQSIGIIGETGSGKTTLIDVMLGLLTPQGGGVYYNGESLKEEVLKNGCPGCLPSPASFFDR